MCLFSRSRLRSGSCRRRSVRFSADPERTPRWVAAVAALHDVRADHAAHELFGKRTGFGIAADDGRERTAEAADRVGFIAFLHVSQTADLTQHSDCRIDAVS